jgi:hypothetical protein
MFIYNVSISVDPSLEQEWQKWMKEDHIPKVLATGMFLECKFCKILSRPEEDPMYACQYFFNSMSDYNRYQEQFAIALQKEHTDKYGEKCLAFRTLMEIL